MSYILGIDPGTRVLGYAVLESVSGSCRYVESGVLKVGAGPLEDRLLVLGQDLSSLFEEYPPEWVALEKIFLGKNVQSAFVLGHVRGLIMYLSRGVGSTLAEYAPRSVKKGITGYGDAGKGQMQGALMSLLKLRGTLSLDASDAMGLALHLGLDKKIWKFPLNMSLEVM